MIQIYFQTLKAWCDAWLTSREMSVSSSSPGSFMLLVSRVFQASELRLTLADWRKQCLVQDIKTAAQQWSSRVSHDPWPKLVLLPLDSKTWELLNYPPRLGKPPGNLCTLNVPCMSRNSFPLAVLRNFSPKSFVVGFIMHFSVRFQCNGQQNA